MIVLPLRSASAIAVRAPTRLRPVSRVAERVERHVGLLGERRELRRRQRLDVLEHLRFVRQRHVQRRRVRVLRRRASFRSCSPSLTSTVTMFACAMAGSFAQPSTLTTLAANGPPSCSASPRGTTNSANSMTTAIRCGALPRLADRLQVERAQQIAIDRARAPSRARAGASSTSRPAPERLLQPVAPVLAAARRAHAAAAVVVQHDVVAGEHHLVEKRRQRQQAAVRRHDVEDVAVEQELRRRARPEQVAHLVGPGAAASGSLALLRARLDGVERRRLGQQILHRAEHLLLIANPLRRPAERRGDLVDALRQRSGSVESAACSRMSSTCCSMRASSASMNASLRSASPRRSIRWSRISSWPSRLRRSSGSRSSSLSWRSSAGATLRQIVAVALGSPSTSAIDVPRDEQPQVHPGQPARGFRSAPRGRAASCSSSLICRSMIDRQRSANACVASPIALGRAGRAQSLMRRSQSPCAPDSCSRVDEPLESAVGRQEQQVAELEAGAEHPEAGIDEPEQAHRREAHPVRRDEHAERPGVERGCDVVQETCFRHEGRRSLWTAPPLEGKGQRAEGKGKRRAHCSCRRLTADGPTCQRYQLTTV